MQRDEWFPLERVVAVVHPTRRIIAYHLLRQDDVHGSRIAFTVPTDEEALAGRVQLHACAYRHLDALAWHNPAH